MDLIPIIMYSASHKWKNLTVREKQLVFFERNQPPKWNFI